MSGVIRRTRCLLGFLLPLCLPLHTEATWPVYLPSRPDIPFETAMKSARKCLGEHQENYYCVAMHWFGIPERPGKGYWGISFWTRDKVFRWIDVFPDGFARWHQSEERRPWSYVHPSSLSFEDAVSIAQRALGPQRDLFLTGGGADNPAYTYYRVQFFAEGAKEYTDLYVTLDGKVYRNENDIPAASP